MTGEAARSDNPWAEASRIVAGYPGQGQLSAPDTRHLVDAVRVMLQEHAEIVRHVLDLERSWPAVRTPLNDLHKVIARRLPHTRRPAPRR